MLTFFRKPCAKLLRAGIMIDSTLYLSAAIAAGCGISVGWFLRGVTRTKSTTRLPATDAKSEEEFEVGTVGTSGECKMVLVVRNDLKMGKGKAAAQCCHAAVMAYEQLYKRHPQLLEEWRRHGQPKVVLKTEDEQSLLEIAGNARSMGLIVSLVRDAGRTQIAPGSKTVISIGPGPKDKIDAVTGHLKLF